MAKKTAKKPKSCAKASSSPPKLQRATVPEVKKSTKNTISRYHDVLKRLAKR